MIQYNDVSTWELYRDLCQQAEGWSIVLTLTTGVWSHLMPSISLWLSTMVFHFLKFRSGCVNIREKRMGQIWRKTEQFPRMQALHFSLATSFPYIWRRESSIMSILYNPYEGSRWRLYRSSTSSKLQDKRSLSPKLQLPPRYVFILTPYIEVPGCVW